MGESGERAWYVSTGAIGKDRSHRDIRWVPSNNLELPVRIGVFQYHMRRVPRCQSQTCIISVARKAQQGELRGTLFRMIVGPEGGKQSLRHWLPTDSCAFGGPRSGPQGIFTVRPELLIPLAGEWAEWGRPTAPSPGGKGRVLEERTANYVAGPVSGVCWWRVTFNRGR